MTLQYEIENDSEMQAAPIFANPVSHRKSHVPEAQIGVPPEGAPHWLHCGPQ
jgi:hypothetical protein